MSTSIMVDMHKKEFDCIELDLAVELGLDIETASSNNLRLDAVGPGCEPNHTLRRKAKMTLSFLLILLALPLSPHLDLVF